VAVALSKSGAKVRELTLRTPTLDDVFLELTGNRFAGDEQQSQSDDESQEAPSR
jgi:ABC-2 type transport system ATP-binding protein